MELDAAVGRHVRISRQLALRCCVMAGPVLHGPQRGLRDEAFGIQSLVPEKQIVERGEKSAVACCQQRVVPALEVIVFFEIAHACL